MGPDLSNPLLKTSNILTYVYDFLVVYNLNVCSLFSTRVWLH